MNKSKKIVTLALLTAVSLVLFMIEAQLPPLTPFPAVKIGLANMVTLFVLYRTDYTSFDAVLVVTIRVLLSGFVAGSLFSLIFSFLGGMSAILVMIVLKKAGKTKLPIWAVSVAGALSHNVTQVCVAVLLYGGFGVLLYLPVLVLGGVLSGLLTGFVAGIILKRI